MSAKYEQPDTILANYWMFSTPNSSCAFQDAFKLQLVFLNQWNNNNIYLNIRNKNHSISIRTWKFIRKLLEGDEWNKWSGHEGLYKEWENVFVPAKKKKKTDQDKEPGPRRAEVPASYLFLPADTAYKTQGHDHEVINTRCTSTSINAGNDGGHSWRLRRRLYKDYPSLNQALPPEDSIKHTQYTQLFVLVATKYQGDKPNINKCWLWLSQCHDTAIVW